MKGLGGRGGQPAGHMDGWRPTACVLVSGLPLLVATALHSRQCRSAQKPNIERDSLVNSTEVQRLILKSNITGDVLEDILQIISSWLS